MFAWNPGTQYFKICQYGVVRPFWVWEDPIWYTKDSKFSRKQQTNTNSNIVINNYMSIRLYKCFKGLDISPDVI